jgi:hypothetical protein
MLPVDRNQRQIEDGIIINQLLQGCSRALAD